MKKITRSRIPQSPNGRQSSLLLIIPLFFIFGNGSGLFAEETSVGKYAFSSAFSTGFLYGQIEEIVYKDSAANYLSQLLWNMKPVFYWGLSLNFEREKPLEGIGFFTNLSVKFGIDGGASCVMEDRDWQDTRDQRLTNYSYHKNYTTNTLIFDFQAGVSVPLFHTISLKMYGFFTFMDFSFESFDGYLQYSALLYHTETEDWFEQWDESIPKVGISGAVINYKQTWAIGGVGVSLRLPVGFFSFGVSFDISPSLIMCAARDTHIIRSLQFNDFDFGGLFLKPSVDMSVSFGRLSVSFAFSWRFLAWAIGDIYEYDIVGNEKYFSKKYPNSSSSGFSFIDVGLSLAWRF